MIHTVPVAIRRLRQPGKTYADGTPKNLDFSLQRWADYSDRGQSIGAVASPTPPLYPAGHMPQRGEEEFPSPLGEG